MNMEFYHLPTGQPLADAYMNHEDERLESLFGYHPSNSDDWARRLQSLERPGILRAPSERVAEALRAYNQRFHITPQTKRFLDALESGAPVIVGGQQAVLWTGPLLVIHKAMSVIQTAKWAEQKLGRTVVPVFWIAGEDHDWDEANHTYIPHYEEGLRRLEASRPEGPRTSVSRTQLGEAQRRALLDTLAASLPDSEHKKELLDRLTTIIGEHTTLTNMFAAMLSVLFGKEGLVLLDSDDPALRKVEGPMFGQLIARNSELEEAYRNTTQYVQELGYRTQAEVADKGANLFLFPQALGLDGYAEGDRTLLFRQGDSFTDRKGTQKWSLLELHEIAETQPELLSNNVLTRPLMQEYLFPVLSTVLGPGEIAYWSQMRAAFDLMDMEMPIITPRLAYTLVEPNAVKHMKGFGLSFEEVLLRFEEYKMGWLKEQDHLGIEERFAEVKCRFEELYRPLLDMAAQVQLGLAPLGETNLERIISQIQYMSDKTEQAYWQTQGTSIRRLDSIANCIAPIGKPQERVLNLMHFWNRYGLSWLDSLLSAPFEPGMTHRIVYL